MKIKTYLGAAFVAAFACNGAAYAAHQPGHPAAPQARAGGNAPGAATTTDNTPMAWRVVRYPFRVGSTVMRAPLIVGQTFTGKRTFISERGFFQNSEGQPAAADQRNSIPQGRGQRTPAH
ncbi:MAG: hypothetical protein WCF18_10475 [Chthoniobacteraceae bacterium]